MSHAEQTGKRKFTMRSVLSVIAAVVLLTYGCAIISTNFPGRSYRGSSNWMTQGELAETSTGELVFEMLRAEFPRDYNQWNYINISSSGGRELNLLGRAFVTAYEVKPSSHSDDVFEIIRDFVLEIQDGAVTFSIITVYDEVVYVRRPKRGSQ